MKHTKVDSSNVESVAWEAPGTLEVKFHNGGVYRYHNVPAIEHAKLLAAESVGSHLHKNISGAHLKGRYPCRKIK